MKKYKGLKFFFNRTSSQRMKITVTMGYCFCLKLAIAKKNNYVNVGQDAEKWTLSYSSGGYVNWSNVSGGQFDSAFHYALKCAYLFTKECHI